jgi:hypothetical protein
MRIKCLSARDNGPLDFGEDLFLKFRAMNPEKAKFNYLCGI